MRRLVWQAEGAAGRAVLRVGDGPEPVARAGEAIVRMTRAAVDGLRAGDAGVVAGREMVGVVMSVADAARGASAALVGKRVVVSPLVACGACDLCRGGLSTHCRERKELGATRDGTLAERVSVPLANLVEVPKELDDDRAAFAVPLGAALHAASLAKLEGKVFVTVIGDSLEAVLAAQVMAQRNASVRLLGRRAQRLSVCEKWGVKHRHIDEAGRRADQDLVLSFSGSDVDLDVALRLARPRATVVLAERVAWTHAREALVPLRDGEMTLIGARGVRLAEAVALLAGGGIDVMALLSGKFAFAKVEGAIAAVQEGSESVWRVVVEG